ncbi:MAG: ComF family protein [Prevotella sp.]|nr:ComF family protein [Prevotella sp.]
MKTSFWSRLLDLLSPRLCTVCGQRLSLSELSLCQRCYLHLPRTGFALSPDDNEMARLFWGLLPIERAAALFYYEPQSEAARLVYDLKYHNHPDIGTDIGRMMAAELQPTGFFEGIDALIPVPLARKRQRQRGYNQSECIARGISEITHLPIVTNAVGRTRFDESQTGLSRWSRQTNVEARFTARETGQLEHCHVLLIDDVCTTGATLTACAHPLLAVPGIRFSILTLGMTRG